MSEAIKYIEGNFKNITQSARVLMRESFEAGQQSQQAKIDELQARVGEALKHVVDHGGYDDLTHVINILKGDKDEI